MEADLLDIAGEILRRAEAKNCTIHLPVDGQAAREFQQGAPSRTILNEGLAEDEMMLDIGPRAIADYSAVISSAKCVLWNGPMGAFEIPPFDVGTSALANAVAQATAAGDLVSIAGGGDTVAALNHAGCADAFSYVSLAGGAFLEWIEGRELPGIAILDSDT
jgi:phosphoglycerate kinase